jgi:hypothetical protein
MTAWLAWFRGMRGPEPAVLRPRREGRGLELTALEKRRLAGEPRLLAAGDDGLSLTQLARLYPPTEVADRLRVVAKDVEEGK